MAYSESYGITSFSKIDLSTLKITHKHVFYYYNNMRLGRVIDTTKFIVGT